MKQLLTPNGDRITGILECVPGNAIVNGFEDDLSPDYEGYTKMFWDGQVEIFEQRNDATFVAGYTGDHTKKIYLDNDGNEWDFEDLTVIESEPPA